MNISPSCAALQAVLRTLYITITMIVRDENHGPALAAFLETAERINRSRAEKLKNAEQTKTARP